MLDFGTRKLQQVRGSYFVPLPPNWIKSNSMKKSDSVRIELQYDGNLKVSPVPATRQDEETGDTDSNQLRRCAGFGNNGVKR